MRCMRPTWPVKRNMDVNGSSIRARSRSVHAKIWNLEASINISKKGSLNVGPGCRPTNWVEDGRG